MQFWRIFLGIFRLLFPGAVFTLRIVLNSLQSFKMNTVKISALVTPEERQMIQARAVQSGLSLSKYLAVTALVSMPEIETLKTLYLKAGEAHTLANLVMNKQGDPAENSVKDINADLADLIQVVARIHTLTKELIDFPHAGKAIQRT